MTTLQEALSLVRTVPDFPQPGVLFRDLNPVFASGPAFRAVIDAMAAQLPSDIDALASIEARGFMLGGALSMVTGKALVPIRKPGKLPAVADRVDYALEYGHATLELPVDVLPPGAQVAVIDDVLATGGTVDATCQLVEHATATVSVVMVVLELSALGGRDRLAGRKVQSLQTI
jgi:adenine phosphoribosyltransferase